MSSAIQKLDDDQTALQWLESLGLRDSKLALANLRSIASSELPAKSLEQLLVGLEQSLPELSDPDRVINNLERFVLSSPETSVTILVRNDQAFGGLLTLFSTSQYLSDILVRQPESFENGWQSSHTSRDNLTEQLVKEIESTTSITAAMATLRQFKHTQTLRTAIDDLVNGQRIEHVTMQISFVASAIVHAAYVWARRDLAQKLGEPMTAAGQPSQFAVIAMGKLGGSELNYSSDIDLVMVYDENGMTKRTGNQSSNNKAVSNQEFYERIGRQMVKLIGEPTELGAAYRVDLRLRPNGASGKICASFQSMLQYYDLQGRTWERQALIKADPVAGDLELGRRLLAELSPWIYRRNLSRADITGIKALKRQIERRALAAGEDRTNVKTGRGGIRDVEFVIQFMQLLNGGDLPEVRTTNTLDAIQRLGSAQCLSPAESTVLTQNYQWLRKLEHRLQLMFDMQTHTLTEDKTELAKIAIRMGFRDEPKRSALVQFQKTFHETTESNRKVLNHLLHGAFGMAFGSLRNTAGQEHRLDQSQVPLEVDLILDPDPDLAMIEEALSPYGFQNPKTAFKHLMDLAREPTQFLSSRRCKHFLASVAPALLAAIAQTPDPDASLVTLTTVSDCLGAKGVLWELFSFNPPTLNLYVRLCASSDYLVGILKSNPGMIDELVDALQLDGLPTQSWLTANMDELTKGAADLTPIIGSFKNTQHMRVGIRDIIGRDDVRDIHRSLAEIAEICLNTVAKRQSQLLYEKYARLDRLDQLQKLESPLVILGLGKLGGREPNYHSDLDVIFLYNSTEHTVAQFEAYLKDGTTSQFFFSELAKSITRFVSHSTGQGRLYEVDSRLRPTGKSGALAVSTDEFKRYFESGQGQLWERQSLCKARPIFGSADNCELAMKLVRDAIKQFPWQPEMASEIRTMRLAMQKDCTQHNLKRGEGGTVDVEFITQMLQLKHSSENESVLGPGTCEALDRLKSLGYLDAKTADRLAEGYQLLRSVEARLRLMNTTARHDLPNDPKQLNKLAYLLNYSDAKELTQTVNEHRDAIRAIFDELVR